MKLTRLLLPPLAVLGALAAVEGTLNSRGPRPRPAPESIAAGRALLTEVVGFQEQAGLGDHGPVHFRVLLDQPLRTALELRLTLDPASRSADIGVPPPTRVTALPRLDRFRYHGSDESVTPQDGGPDAPHVRGRLAPIAPSLVFWSLAPWILDDAKAIVWRLPDGRWSGEAARRIAVRWPGETDWFTLFVAAGESRLLGVEFLDARATIFLRWRGNFDGRQTIDGVGFPRAWRFRPARATLSFLTGGGDLFVFRYGPIM